MMTPYLPPEHNRLTMDASSRIDVKGDLVSDVTISGHGYLEDRLRRLVAYRSIDELWPTVTADLVRVAPGAKLERLRFSDHRNLKEPFVIKLRYRVPRYANVGVRAMRTGLPLSAHILGDQFFADWLVATEPAKRSSAIWLRSPQLVTFTERLELPRGFTLVGARLDQELATSMGSLRATLHQDKQALVFEEVVRISQRNIAPGDYAALKEVTDAVRELSGRRFYLEREGGES
jgi:hypothetical protein